MLKAFIDRILELSKIRTIENNDEIYTKEFLYRLRRTEQQPPTTLGLNNLTGLVDYSKKINYDKTRLFFAVMNPSEVLLMSSPDPINENIQFTFATAKLQVDNFKFGNWYDLESFIINLLSLFERTEQRDATIEMMANIANEHVIQNTDDKFSQSLQVRTGLTIKANEKVENPVSLVPYRTFREIEQTGSNFILRYQNRNGKIEAALFEGDGGTWKLDAILRIKDWLLLKTDISVIG